MMSSFAYDRWAPTELPKCPSVGPAKCPEGPIRAFPRCPCRCIDWESTSSCHGPDESRWQHLLERSCRKRIVWG